MHSAAGRTRRSDRVLALAALASAAIHALLISGAWLPLPRLPAAHEPLEARLAAAPPEVKPAHPPTPSRRLSAPRRAHAPVPAPVAALPAPPSVVAQSSSAPPAEAQPEAIPEAPGVTAPANPEPPLQREPPPPQPQPVRSLPKKGRITFALTYGGDRFSVGKAVQSWEVGPENYMLASDAETTGIVDLFRPQRLRYLSQGKITRQGLRPASFLASRTHLGQTEAAEALFNWDTGSLTYGQARERTHAALPAGTQDIMSFVYQFALSPPTPGRFRLPITTGSRFETYDIEVRDEESIETPLGLVRALPVKQQGRPGAETIEIWLGAEYRYLPVKIRYFDREGKPAGEQVASEIRISDD